MDSLPEFSETLEFILQHLRAEGFYAAEEALVSELENRNPERRSPSDSEHRAEPARLHGQKHPAANGQSRSPSSSRPALPSNYASGYRSNERLCFSRQSNLPTFAAVLRRHATSCIQHLLCKCCRELEDYRESRAIPHYEEDRQSIEQLYNHIRGIPTVENSASSGQTYSYSSTFLPTIYHKLYPRT